MSEADLRSLFGVRRVECRVLFDQTLYDEHAALEDRFHALVQGNDKNGSLADAADAMVIAERLNELQEQITDAEVVIVVQSIGTKRWLALKAEHPPTREQRLAGLDVNHDTFAPAAVVACTVEVRDPTDPERRMTPELAELMYELLPQREFERVFAPIVDLNVGSDGRPKSLIASVARRLNGASPTTVAPEESHDPSSSDGSQDPGSLAG
jgi:hypothetical protein